MARIQSDEIKWSGAAPFAPWSAVGADMEWVVVWWLVHHPDQIRASGLEAEDFASPESRAMFGALARAEEEGEPVSDAGALPDLVRREQDEIRRAALQQWLNRSITSNWYFWQMAQERFGRLAGRLKQARYMRECQRRAGLLREAASSDEAAEAWRAATEELERLWRRCRGDADEHEVGDVREVLAQAAQSRIVTGIDRLDRALGGGIPRGAVVAMLAVPGCGKTALAVSAVLGALREDSRATALVATLDMSERELWSRIVQIGAGMTREDVRDCVEGSREWPPEVARVNQMRRRIIVRNDLLTADDIAGAVTRYGADIVVVDYVQALRSRDARETEVDRVRNAMAAFKVSAIESDAVVVVISQVRREDSDMQRMPRLQSGRGSSGIEADARVVLGLCRPDYGRELLEGSRVIGLKVGVLKNTFGALGHTRLRYDLWTQRVE